MKPLPKRPQKLVDRDLKNGTVVALGSSTESEPIVKEPMAEKLRTEKPSADAAAMGCTSNGSVKRKVVEDNNSGSQHSIQQNSSGSTLPGQTLDAGGQVEDQEQSSAMDQPVDPTIRRNRTFRLAALLALVMALLFLGFSYLSNSPDAVTPLSRVTLSSATVSSFSEYVPVSGSVIPSKTVFLDSVEGGRVVSIEAEAGQIVEQGAPIITLRNSDLELQVMAHEAQYTEQVNNLARTQMEFDRINLDYDLQIADAKLEVTLTSDALTRRVENVTSAYPRSEIERLRTQLDHYRDTLRRLNAAKARDRGNAQASLLQLKNSVKRMQDSLDLLRISLGDLAVRAPLSGQITTLDLRVGEVIAPGARVGQIDQVGQYKVRALIDEFYLARFTSGLTATTMIDQVEYQLTVSKIFPNVENRRFAVELEFTGLAPQRIRAGQSMRLRIALGEVDDVLTITNGAFYEDTGGVWLYVLNNDATQAVKRQVRLGRRNTDSVEVLAGLSEGEQVVISSYELFGDAESIKFTQ